VEKWRVKVSPFSAYGVAWTVVEVWSWASFMGILSMGEKSVKNLLSRRKAAWIRAW
jgi:hypothetical protein